MRAEQLVDAMRGAMARQRIAEEARDNTAMRERNDWLRLHHLAREARPTSYALNLLAGRYPKGVRFRISTYVANFYGGARTIYRPIIEVVQQVRGGKWMWLPYSWPGDEL